MAESVEVQQQRNVIERLESGSLSNEFVQKVRDMQLSWDAVMALDHSSLQELGTISVKDKLNLKILQKAYNQESKKIQESRFQIWLKTKGFSVDGVAQLTQDISDEDELLEFFKCTPEEQKVTLDEVPLIDQIRLKWVSETLAVRVPLMDDDFEVKNSFESWATHAELDLSRVEAQDQKYKIKLSLKRPRSPMPKDHSRQKKLVNDMKKKYIDTEIKPEKWGTCITLKPTQRKFINSQHGIIQYQYGHPPAFPMRQKTILMMGETGSGKSTMLNAIAGHVLGVCSTDNFRLNIVQRQADEMKRSEDQSQTQWISVYTIYPNQYMDYTLHIIDTPGFGATEGKKRDERLVQQMKALFSCEVDESSVLVDIVCFTGVGSAVRLTPHQQYIIDSIFELFGKDIKENIVIIATFTHTTSRPNLAKALNTAKIPFRRICCVDNVTPDEDLAFECFAISDKSIIELLYEIDTVSAKSLVLSAEVVEERKLLENTVQRVTSLIKRLLSHLKELQQINTNISDHESNKTQLEEVEVDEPHAVHNPTEDWHTNCVTCKHTCGDGWWWHVKVWRFVEKIKPSADVCECKHPYKEHEKQQFSWVQEVRRIKKTRQDLMGAFNVKTDNVHDLQKIIQTSFLDDIKDFEENLTSLENSANRIREIALKPTVTDFSSIIDDLIQTETYEQAPGHDDRGKLLLSIKIALQKIIAQNKISPQPRQSVSFVPSISEIVTSLLGYHE